MSTSVNVLSSNLGQVGVRGYVMKGLCCPFERGVMFCDMRIKHDALT